MWERFEIYGFEQTTGFYDKDGGDVDEDEAIDIALRKRLETVNLGAVKPTELNPFYDDGDETVTNVMRKIGNVFTQRCDCQTSSTAIGRASDDDVKQSSRATTGTLTAAQWSPEWSPYPLKTVRLIHGSRLAPISFLSSDVPSQRT